MVSNLHISALLRAVYNSTKWAALQVGWGGMGGGGGGGGLQRDCSCHNVSFKMGMWRVDAVY